MAVHTSTSTGQAEAGRLRVRDYPQTHEVGGQPGIHEEVLSQTKTKQTNKWKSLRVPEPKTCAPGRRSALPGAKHFLTSSSHLQCSHYGFIVCLIIYIVNHYIHFGIM